MQSGAIVPGDTHSAMNEATEKKPRTRTDWNFELLAACGDYAKLTGRTITASARIYPPMAGIVIRVDDTLPHVFDTEKQAAERVRAWSTAP
jgi:hypothetical protein